MPTVETQGEWAGIGHLVHSQEAVYAEAKELAVRFEGEVVLWHLCDGSDVVLLVLYLQKDTAFLLTRCFLTSHRCCTF